MRIDGFLGRLAEPGDDGLRHRDSALVVTRQQPARALHRDQMRTVLGVEFDRSPTPATFLVSPTPLRTELIMFQLTPLVGWYTMTVKVFEPA